MDSFDKMMAENGEYKQARDEKYKQESKTRLSKIAKKKVETTMIGALSSIEENFGFLWGSGDSNMTPEERKMFDIYQKVRAEILDRGNLQARNLDAELSNHEVKWLKFTVDMPVRPIRES